MDMLKDLQELSKMLDGFIDKYKKEIEELSKEKAQLSKINGSGADLADGMEGCTIGNDYY